MGSSDEPPPPTQNIYYEDCMQIIGYGRMRKIHNIYMQGKKLLKDPISSASTPSGSAVDLGGKEGVIYIYWGENDQPVCGSLAALSGVASSYPNVAYVFWKKKRLGASPNWGQLEYDADFYALNTDLTPKPYSDASYYSHDITYTHTNQFDDFITLNSGYLVVGRTVTDSVTDAIFTIINITNVGGQDRYYIDIYLPFTASSRAAVARRVTQRGVVFSDVLNHLLKAPFPLGLALDDTIVEPCEVTGVGVVSHSRSFLNGGKTFGDGIKAIAEDNGMLTFFDTATGVLRYKLMRKDVIEPLVISIADWQPLDEALVIARETNKADRIIWEYVDINRNFNPSTLASGTAPSHSPNVSLQIAKTQLNTVTDVKTASDIVTRRTQEKSVNSSYSIKLQGAYASLNIGTKVQLEGDISGSTYIVFDTKYEPNGSSVKVSLLNDIYSVGQYVTYDELIGSASSNIFPYPDSIVILVEPNRFVAAGSNGICVGRARFRNTVSGSNILLSDTGVSYEVRGKQKSIGGFLLSSDVAVGVIQDIPITRAGSDLISHITDLRSNPTAYYAGSQVVFIGEEILFVEYVEVIDSETFILKNALRGRLGTVAKELFAGDKGCIDISESLVTLHSPLITTGQAVYAKSLPFTSLQSLTASDVTAVSTTYKGGGTRPAPPSAVYKEDFTSSFISTDDLDLSWYGANATGSSVSGIVPAGNVTTESTVEGTYILVIRNVTSTVKETKQLSISTYLLTNVEIISIFGSVPAEIYIDVLHILNGVASEIKTTIFERI